MSFCLHTALFGETMAEHAERELFLKHLAEAKKELGLSFDLKDRQIEALEAMYNGKDVVCVLPTGYGKSAIFQLLPPLMKLKFGMDRLPVVIVITPLNAIMQDQVLSLSRMGFMACFLDIKGVGASTCRIGTHR
jgi:superfamily II DNA helicase RecQ